MLPWSARARVRVLVQEVHGEFAGTHAERQDTDQWLLLMSSLLLGGRWDPRQSCPKKCREQ